MGADALVERFAREKLHADDQNLGWTVTGRNRPVAKYVECAAHIRVSYFSRELDFPPESFDFMERLDILETRGLYRNPFLQLFVLSFVDFSHAATGYETNHSESSGQ